jgi:hypothetical protein
MDVHLQHPLSPWSPPKHFKLSHMRCCSSFKAITETITTGCMSTLTAIVAEHLLRSYLRPPGEL